MQDLHIYTSQIIYICYIFYMGQISLFLPSGNASTPAVVVAGGSPGTSAGTRTTSKYWD